MNEVRIDFFNVRVAFHQRLESLPLRHDRHFADPLVAILAWNERDVLH